MMFSKGDIVSIQFPFSNLMEAKKRPMLVLAEKGDDIIGCAVTSNPNVKGVPCEQFSQGQLPLQSTVKYWQIHTFLKSLAVGEIATLSAQNHQRVLTEIEKLLKM